MNKASYILYLDSEKNDLLFLSITKPAHINSKVIITFLVGVDDIDKGEFINLLGVDAGRNQNINMFMSLEKNFDEELFILWMQKHHYIPWISCTLYTLAVLATHRWIRNKLPVEFGTLVLPIWNALFALCNLIIFMKVAPTRLNILWNHGWTHSICNFYSHVGPVAF